MGLLEFWALSELSRNFMRSTILTKVRLVVLIAAFGGFVQNTQAYDPTTHQKMGDVAREHFEELLLNKPDIFPSIGSLMVMDAQQKRLKISETYWKEFHFWLRNEDEEWKGVNTRYHFWDPVYDKGLFTFDSSLFKAQEYWDTALEEYTRHLDPVSAFQYLGRVCHLLGDAGCPAHTLLDPHYDSAVIPLPFTNLEVPLADNDIDTLHSFAARRAVIDDKSIHWTGNKLLGIGNDIFSIMRSIAAESSKWDSDDANGRDSTMGGGRLNGEKWRINGPSPWHLKVWRDSRLAGFPAELHTWIEAEKLQPGAKRGQEENQAARVLIYHLINEIPKEVLKIIDERPNDKLGDQDLASVLDALQRTILFSQEELPLPLLTYELGEPTRRWAGHAILEAYILVEKTDNQFFRRKKLGMLLEAFPKSLRKDFIDVEMLWPISDTDLRRIARANIPNVEKGIAMVLAQFFDQVRPKLLLLERAKVTLRAGNPIVEFVLKITSPFPAVPLGEAAGISEVIVEISAHSQTGPPPIKILASTLLAEDGASIAQLPIRISADQFFPDEENTVTIRVVDFRGVQSKAVIDTVFVGKDSAGPLVRNVRP